MLHELLTSPRPGHACLLLPAFPGRGRNREGIEPFSSFALPFSFEKKVPSFTFLLKAVCLLKRKVKPSQSPSPFLQPSSQNAPRQRAGCCRHATPVPARAPPSLSSGARRFSFYEGGFTPRLLLLPSGGEIIMLLPLRALFSMQQHACRRRQAIMFLLES